MRIHDYSRHWARTSPEAPACSDGTRSWTYGELDRRSNAFAALLAEHGLGKGDRLGILAGNRLEWLSFYFGASRVGVVPVPLNVRLVAPEWRHILTDSDTRLVVVDGALAAGLDPIADEVPSVKAWLSFGTAPGGRWADVSEALEATGSFALPADDVSEDDDLYQMYTSGTTGRPKGAVLTHRAINANVQQIQTGEPIMPGERVLTVMPLFHAGAAVATFAQMAAGAEVRVMAAFDPHACVEALATEDIAWATFVPAMIQAMLVAVPDVANHSYDSLRAITYGASPIAEETLRTAMATFGCGFRQAYGMTECSAALTVLGTAEHERALRDAPGLLLSCGRPLLGTEVRIVDEDDNDVPVGEVGEIIGRGPQVMKGYWNMPEQTTEAMRGGWMHTGDAGRMDEHGYIYVSDRVKDMMVSGGLNVYPREIEEVLFQVAEVADAAVVGVPDDKWGEVGKAFLVPRPGMTIDAEAVLAHCKANLAGYKVPKSVEIVDELPRNASGKVLKQQLRAPYWEGRSRNV